MPMLMPMEAVHNPKAPNSPVHASVRTLRTLELQVAKVAAAAVVAPSTSTNKVEYPSCRIGLQRSLTGRVSIV